MTSILKSSTSGPASIPLHEGIINNKIFTNTIRSMPFKPDTMEQGNDFSLGRAAFMRMNTKMSAKPPTASEIANSKSNNGGGNGFTGGLISKMGNLAAKNQLVGKGGKNWAAASDYTQRKRLNAIGKGSMGNTNNPVANTSFMAQDQTSVKTAIWKARGGGSAAPKKKGAVNTK